MKNLLEYNFVTKDIKPILIVMTYINRNMIIRNIDKKVITLKEDMENDIHILIDCFNIIITNVLDMFVRSYVYEEEFKKLNNELNVTLNNISTDIIDKYLMTSIDINERLLFKTIHEIYTYIENIMLKKTSKIGITNVNNMYDINIHEIIYKGSYIYNVDNDCIKIVVFDNV
jgi:hypothetical protein